MSVRGRRSERDLRGGEDRSRTKFERNIKQQNGEHFFLGRYVMKLQGKGGGGWISERQKLTVKNQKKLNKL